MNGCKMVLSVVASALALAAVGGRTNVVVRVGDRVITPKEVQAALAELSRKRTGGLIREAGSAKGWFVVVNAQKSVPQSEIDKVLATIDRQVLVQVKSVPSADVTQTNVGEAIRKAGGEVGVALVEGGDAPALVCAPEEGWAIVNVAKLRPEKKDDAVFHARVRRELLRGFAFVSGGAYPGLGDFVMRPVSRPADLDQLPGEEFSNQMLMFLSVNTKAAGLAPWHESTYLRACQEGWAPAPTNEYQKAIWDKVHAIPSKPLKIEYNEKRDKGK